MWRGILVLAAGVLCGGALAGAPPGPQLEPCPRQVPPVLCADEVRSPFGMVVTSSPEASAVGARILEEGGNAVDAAVATAFALGVAEPGSSGLGGGSAILLRLADGRAVAIDGTVTVPRRVDRYRMQTARDRGEPLGYMGAATPTTLAALVTTLERYGTMRLVPSVLITISNVIDRGLPLKRAMELPRVLWGGRKENKVYLEIAPPVDDRQADELVRRGFSNLYRLRFPPRDIDLSAFGGVNAIAVEDGHVFVGVADPRRQGCAAAATR